MSLCTVPSLDILQERIFKYLDIRDILNLIDTNRHLADNAISYLSKMKKLDFSERWQEAISERQFSILHENCTNIAEVNLNFCFWVTGPQLKPLVDNNWDHLESIHLMFCGRLNFEDIFCLTQCMRIKEIELQGLKMCTQDELFEVEEIFFENFIDYWGELIEDTEELKLKIKNLKFLIDGKQAQILWACDALPLIMRTRDADASIIDHLNSSQLSDGSETSQFSDVSETSQISDVSETSQLSYDFENSITLG